MELTTRRVIGTLIGAAVVASCARSIPPGGGPEDRTPPVVVSVAPESLEVSVAADAEIRILFSEKIDRATLDRALWISPPRVPKSISVSGEEARITLRDPLPDSTTIQVSVTTAVEDGRRNSLAEPYSWIFATGDSIAAGRVYGAVERVGGNRAGQVLVALYPVLADTLPDPAVETPRAVTQADGTGDFSLDGLETEGRLHLLYAMLDRDGNRDIIGRGEYYSAAPESVTLSAETPDARRSLRLVDPEAPATIQGTLTRAEGDSIAVWVALYAAEDDSMTVARHSAESDTTGGFRLGGVRPGVYKMIGFCDADSNGVRTDEDLWLVLDAALRVEAGERHELGERAGPRCLP